MHSINLYNIHINVTVNVQIYLQFVSFFQNSFHLACLHLIPLIWRHKSELNL